MDFQKKTPEEVHKILKSKGVKAYDIEYFAWPQVFGSTLGPRHGIGGQAMSTFTVEAWVCNNDGPTVYTCAGMYYFDEDKFEPLMNIMRWHEIES